MRKGRARYYKQAHRNPPMPEWFMDAPWGICRWCGHLIWKEDGVINTRRRWHTECLHPYWLVSDQKYAKRQVKKRDKGICKYCGKFCRYRWEWQLDHIKPLIDAKGDISFWQLENLCVACNACHNKKTMQENAERNKKKMDKRSNPCDDNQSKQ